MRIIAPVKQTKPHLFHFQIAYTPMLFSTSVTPRIEKMLAVTNELKLRSFLIIFHAGFGYYCCKSPPRSAYLNEIVIIPLLPRPFFSCILVGDQYLQCSIYQ